MDRILEEKVYGLVHAAERNDASALFARAILGAHVKAMEFEEARDALIREALEADPHKLCAAWLETSLTER